MFLTVGAIILVLGVLIFVHELGHFLVAKAVGIQVLRFSLGFGRPLVSVRRGETEYWLSWIPFGGYVKMAGLDEEGPQAELEGGTAAVPIDPERTFDRQPLWARVLVILAGVTMNLLFAVAVYSGLAFTGRAISSRLATTAVDSVDVAKLPEGARALGSLRRRDRIVTVDDDSVTLWLDLLQRIISAPSPVRVGVAGRAEPLVLHFFPGDTAARYATARALSYFIPPEVAEVTPGSPAGSAGFLTGDRVIRVNGDTVPSWPALVRRIGAHPEDTLQVTVQRDSGTAVLTLVPMRRRERDPTTGRTREFGFAGIRPVALGVPPVGPLASLRWGVEETFQQTGLIVSSVWRLVTGRLSLRELGGPILIGQVSGQAARAGVDVLLSLMAFISINLAVLNLLPIPVLDGGHLAFLAIEKVRGKPLSPVVRLRWAQIGLAVVMGIMAIALANDVLRLFGR